MSQIFSCDCQITAVAVTIPTTTETAVALTNPLRPPFENGKAVVWGVIQFTAGTAATAVSIRVRRNQSSENVLLNGGGESVTVVAGTAYMVPFAFYDQVPDGRDCVYTVTVQQVSATGNGTVNTPSTIVAQMISG